MSINKGDKNLDHNYLNREIISTRDVIGNMIIYFNTKFQTIIYSIPPINLEGEIIEIERDYEFSESELQEIAQLKTQGYYIVGTKRHDKDSNSFYDYLKGEFRDVFDFTDTKTIKLTTMYPKSFFNSTLTSYDLIFARLNKENFDNAKIDKFMSEMTKNTHLILGQGSYEKRFNYD